MKFKSICLQLAYNVTPHWIMALELLYDKIQHGTYGSGHETAAVLLPGFAIIW